MATNNKTQAQAQAPEKTDTSKGYTILWETEDARDYKALTVHANQLVWTIKRLQEQGCTVISAKLEGA